MNACGNSERLSQKTLLAMLPSRLDSDQAIVAATGETIDISDEDQKTIDRNIRKKIWLPVELNYPRKFLLYNESKWQIDSYDSYKKLVCISYHTPSGTRRMSFTLHSL